MTTVHSAKITEARRIVVLLFIAIFYYLPALRLPFISDDYTEIPLSLRYAEQGWVPLWQDLHSRTRATHMLLSAILDKCFGFTPVPFYAASLLLHTMCVVLVYAVFREINGSSAFWAAGFFAIYEGHQEAVMWVAASSELLVFLFGMTCCLCWLRWLQKKDRRWYFAALGTFLLGCFSKESIWIFPILMILLCWRQSESVRLPISGILPFLGFATLYCAWIWISRPMNAPLDTRFSLSSPWPIVIIKSFWRMIFIWGLIAAAIIVRFGRRVSYRMLWIGSLWIVLGLVPYSFLTYMLHVPSRHTYIASAGLALLVGTAISELREDRHQILATGLIIVALLLNLEVLWVKKMGQYRERAEPSELLKDAVSKAAGPIFVDCTSLNSYVVQNVVEYAGGHAVFRHPAEQDKPHCFALEYMDHTGRLVRISRRVEGQPHNAFH